MHRFFAVNGDDQEAATKGALQFRTWSYVTLLTSVNFATFVNSQEIYRTLYKVVLFVRLNSDCKGQISSYHFLSRKFSGTFALNSRFRLLFSLLDLSSEAYPTCLPPTISRSQDEKLLFFRTCSDTVLEFGADLNENFDQNCSVFIFECLKSFEKMDRLGSSWQEDPFYKCIGSSSQPTAMSCDTKTEVSSGNRYNVLCYEQVLRLHEFMEEEVCLQGRGHCPAVRLTLKDFVQKVRQRLEDDGVPVRDVRLNGGVATYIIGMGSVHTYNDLDLLFGVDLSQPQTAEAIRRCVLECLLSFLPAGAEEQLRRRHSSSGRPQFGLADGYVRKLVRVQNSDSWFLISLGDSAGHQSEGVTVELKFVDRMRRKFEFTVDSFQIILDSLLAFYNVKSQPAAITEHFYPTVVAEAVSGSFAEAYQHLLRKEISTRNPEEIRGGGLLKYCKLLVDGFLPAQGLDVVHLEKYMCSRFFIDFPDLKQQRSKIESYLLSHFPADRDLEQRVQYLQILHEVVKSSTVCLMQQERRSTLYLVSDMVGELCLDIEARSNVIALEPFNSADWVLDQVYYGTQFFPAVATPAASPCSDACVLSACAGGVAYHRAAGLQDAEDSLRE